MSNPFPKNRFTEKLRNGELLFGPNLHFDSPALVEIAGIAGFDFVLLDGEHGVVYQQLPQLVITADAARITPIIRIPSHERGYLIRALELGAGGVMVPMVENVEQAKAITAEAKFPPYGNRGFANVTRAGRYGAISAKEFPEYANANTALILLLESVEAFTNAEAIAEVPGVDMLFIGPSDFAQSMGHSGNPEHPEVQAAIQAFIIRLSKKIPVGIASFSATEPESISQYARFGAQVFLISSVAPIRKCFENMYQKLKGNVPK
jgi:4-hydroxy-2-oxoheptanedioate aldolase